MIIAYNPAAKREPVSYETLLRRERAVYGVFCNAVPPLALVRDPERSLELQNWILARLKRPFAYATGISIMDAAWAIARSQIENGYEQPAEEGQAT